MLFLPALVTRGPDKGRSPVLARNRRGEIVTALDRAGADRVGHHSEELAARAVRFAAVVLTSAPTAGAVARPSTSRAGAPASG